LKTIAKNPPLNLLIDNHLTHDLKTHISTNKTPENHHPKPLIKPLMNLPTAQEHPPKKIKIKINQIAPNHPSVYQVVSLIPLGTNQYPKPLGH
jgi:hypothetical protein